MSRTSTLILLGVIAVFAPFSGFPIAFRNLAAVVVGVCVAGIGLSMRARDVRDAAAQPPSDLTPSEPASPPTISSV